MLDESVLRSICKVRPMLSPPLMSELEADTTAAEKLHHVAHQKSEKVGIKGATWMNWTYSYQIPRSLLNVVAMGWVVAVFAISHGDSNHSADSTMQIIQVQ